MRSNAMDVIRKVGKMDLVFFSNHFSGCVNICGDNWGASINFNTRGYYWVVTRKSLVMQLRLKSRMWLCFTCRFHKHNLHIEEASPVLYMCWPILSHPLVTIALSSNLKQLSLQSFLLTVTPCCWWQSQKIKY